MVILYFPFSFFVYLPLFPALSSFPSQSIPPFTTASTFGCIITSPSLSFPPHRPWLYPLPSLQCLCWHSTYSRRISSIAWGSGSGWMNIAYVRALPRWSVRVDWSIHFSFFPWFSSFPFNALIDSSRRSWAYDNRRPANRVVRWTAASLTL